MAFKLKAPYKINNIPVHEVPFSMDNDKGASDGLVAKANDNFSIIINKNKATDGPLMAKAMSHEGEHLRQMFGIGKYEPESLKYNEEGVEFEGKFHNRNSPNFDESDRSLPYEAPAYAAGESLKPLDDINPDNMKQGPGFNMLGSRGQDQESVSMNERFGAAMKQWHGAAKFNMEGEGDKIKKTWKGQQEGVQGTFTEVKTPGDKTFEEAFEIAKSKGWLKEGETFPEYKERAIKESTTTSFKPDEASSTTETTTKKTPPPKEIPPPPKDYGYLDHAQRSQPYRGATKQWGGELLAGTNIEKTRELTPDEARYLGYTPENYGGNYTDYANRKKEDYVGFWERSSNNPIAGNTEDFEESIEAGKKSLSSTGYGGSTGTDENTGIINDTGELVN